MGAQQGGTNLGLAANGVQEERSWATLVRKLGAEISHGATCLS